MPAHMSPPAGRPVGSGSSLIWKVRPQVFSAPGKNSASLGDFRHHRGQGDHPQVSHVVDRHLVHRLGAHVVVIATSASLVIEVAPVAWR